MMRRYEDEVLPNANCCRLRAAFPDDPTPLPSNRNGRITWATSTADSAMIQPLAQ